MNDLNLLADKNFDSWIKINSVSDSIRLTNSNVPHAWYLIHVYISSLEHLFGWLAISKFFILKPFNHFLVISHAKRNTQEWLFLSSHPLKSQFGIL